MKMHDIHTIAVACTMQPSYIPSHAVKDLVTIEHFIDWVESVASNYSKSNVVQTTDNVIHKEILIGSFKKWILLTWHNQQSTQ